MFTGIVEALGRVQEQPMPDRPLLWIDGGALAETLRPGDSLAVNGCCLTVTERKATSLRFDTLEETRRRTNVGRLEKGDLVNLERSVAVGSRIDGHFVTGHVDGLSRLLEIRNPGAEHELWFERGKEWETLIVPKGSIALDGISLTVGVVREDRFSVWITPFTWQATNLPGKRQGDLLNLEVDILARYVAAQIGKPLPERA
ncbi:riboflavin synthase [Methylacidimicrobium sp. B4]|uniref:riboflavin synthase n=1 Tax=Methylacidimicrobium sp. B4 TaxID=2796139 RepID=UPI001A8D15DD|nr:riboflavin synthase [Methylacidimicrobium sp. B4]QSR84021.1 riboflavin synthase [Methylacidimicrobium sp. B4]